MSQKPIFTDTHCHIHDRELFTDDREEAYAQALAAGVRRLLCIGTDIQSSKEALVFAQNHDNAYASFGIHPHDSVKELGRIDEFLAWSREHASEKVVAIGEIGLDYHYMNSPREQQIALLEQQIDLALELGLPISFHVREAFSDFWSLLNNFPGVRGVLHSFTDSVANMEIGLENGLYIGVNGIATFAPEVSRVVEHIPLDKLLFETDTPYLTPAPLRGKINVPGNVGIIASYVAELRGITVEELSQRTEESVSRLFF